MADERKNDRVHMIHASCSVQPARLAAAGGAGALGRSRRHSSLAAAAAAAAAATGCCSGEGAAETARRFVRAALRCAACGRLRRLSALVSSCCCAGCESGEAGGRRSRRQAGRSERCTCTRSGLRIRLAAAPPPRPLAQHTGLLSHSHCCRCWLQQGACGPCVASALESPRSRLQRRAQRRQERRLHHASSPPRRALHLLPLAGAPSTSMGLGLAERAMLAD